MKIYVGPHNLAKRFKPEGKAYAIRIAGTSAKAGVIVSEPLRGEYVFVDILRFDETSRRDEETQNPRFENARIENVLRRMFGTSDEYEDQSYCEQTARRILGRMYRKRTGVDLRLFDKQMAEGVLDNFLTFGKGCEELLVHCHAGQERSPALAMGLRDKLKLEATIFKLGATNGDITPSEVGEGNAVLSFPYYDKQVYGAVIDVGREY